MKWNFDQAMAWLKRQPQRVVLVLVALLVALVGAADWVTGPEISTSIFYLLPVSVATWFSGRRAGLRTAVISAAFWLFNDLSTGFMPSNPWIPYWNAGVRLGLFSIVVLTLSHSRRAQLRQELLTEFIIHDLRSPLANILASLELLEFELAEASNIALEMVHLGTNVGNQMLLLINSLLDLGRLEAGRMPVTLEPVPAADLVQTACQQVQLAAQRKKVTIQTGFVPGDLYLLADATLAERVLLNLLNNALKFSPAQSVVTVTVEPGGKQARIGVQDQGPGIPPQWQHHVFERFAQIDARKGGVAVGSGLGLTFCRMAVEAQNGRIWIETHPERGTLIYFTLPVV